MELWAPTTPGLLTLPSGRSVRGRGLAHPLPLGQHPTIGLYLLEQRPPSFAWERRWLEWPDWGIPADAEETARALRAVWRKAPTERIELACFGGCGRTGTALACLAILDGVAPAAAARYVRDNYRPDAVETPEQERFVADFPNPPE